MAHTARVSTEAAVIYAGWSDALPPVIDAALARFEGET